VTFSYPGSQSTKPALRNVSCTIGAGQLVVIVGENGSGKSTFVKLLTRLHNPASGSIFIDGRQADAYRVRGLRAATALLSQDHTLFPSPVGENISLGRPNADVSQAEIEDAARRGGAHGFITKLAKGYDTVLAPVATKGQVGVPMSSPLMKVLEKLEKRTDVSGTLRFPHPLLDARLMRRSRL
jgi:ABC-type multidrug transport system fused ATPase/permease subunit